MGCWPPFFFFDLCLIFTPSSIALCSVCVIPKRRGKIWTRRRRRKYLRQSLRRAAIEVKITNHEIHMDCPNTWIKAFYHSSPPPQLETKRKSLECVILLVGSVAEEEAPRSKAKSSLKSRSSCPTSARTQSGSTL